MNIEYEHFVFERLLKVRRYDLVLHLVQSTRCRTDNLLVLVYVFCTDSSILHQPGALQLLDSLLVRILKVYVHKIEMVMFMRLQYPNSPQLRQIFIRRAEDLCVGAFRRRGVSWLCLILKLLADIQNLESVSRERLWEKSQHLVWCVEVGMTTFWMHAFNYHSDVLETCARNRMFPELRLLYKAGGVTNRELHIFRSGRIGHGGPRTLMDDFIDHIISNPRDLKSLCAAVVSDCIGLGGDRESRAEALKLPRTLVREVLFKDHIHEYQKAVDRRL